MRHSTVRAVFALVAIGSLVACGPDGTTAVHTEDREAPTPTSPTASPVLAFPPLVAPGSIYDRVSTSTIPGKSRYVLYADGTFSLQYLRPDFGFFEYRGQYSLDNSLVRFAFNARGPGGPWLARGIVQGDSLVVTVNDVMLFDDFEHGVYRLAK